MLNALWRSHPENLFFLPLSYRLRLKLITRPVNAVTVVIGFNGVNRVIGVIGVTVVIAVNFFMGQGWFYLSGKLPAGGFMLPVGSDLAILRDLRLAPLRLLD